MKLNAQSQHFFRLELTYISFEMPWQSYMLHICGAQFCNYMRNCTEAIYFSRTNTFVVACSEKCIIESIQCCTCFRYQTSV